MCIAATVAGLGSAGSITAFVAAKLRSSIRAQDPPKTETAIQPDVRVAGGLTVTLNT